MICCSVTTACALYPWMFGCPWVRISRESGSVTLILPSGTSGGEYGLAGTSRTAGRHCAVPSGGSARRPGWRRAQTRAPHPSVAALPATAPGESAGPATGLARAAPRALAVLAQPHRATVQRGREPIPIELQLDLGDHLLTRLLRRGTLALEPLPRRLQRGSPALAGAQLLGQLIPARVPEPLVLLAVDPLGLLRGSRSRSTHTHGCDPATRSRASCVPSTAISPTRTSPASPHNPSTSHEQLADRGLVPAAELRDRRVIRHRHRRDHLERHILPTRPLDLPSRTGTPTHTSTKAARPSSPGHTPPDPARSPDTPHRTRPDPSARPRRAPSTPSDPPATNPSVTAATTSPGRGHTR